jgi:hypothetical protein
VPGFVAVGDFEGDADLDVIGFDLESGSTVVAAVQTDGVFATLEPIAVPAGADHLPGQIAFGTTGDVDGDGLLDILYQSASESPSWHVRFGDSYAPYADGVEIPLPWRIALADLDGDGDDDAILLDDDGLAVAMSESRSFTRTPLELPLPAASEGHEIRHDGLSLLAADMDAAPGCEIVLRTRIEDETCSGLETGLLHVLGWDGAAVTARWSEVLYDAYDDRGIAAGDFDGDGLADLAFVGAISETTYALQLSRGGK